jgi:hypothetical protein
MTTYKGLKLFPAQKEIAEKITSTPTIKGTVNYFTVCCSRQFGKSTCLQQILLWFAINEPNSKCLFVSMTYSQVGKIYNSILRAIEKSGIISKKNGIEYSLILKNGSEIYFRSYTRADTIRGLSANTLIIDESAYLRDDDWQAVFRPTLATIGKRCILFSTPRGKSNYFYTCFMKGESMEYPNYYSFRYTYRDNPYANLSEIEDARLSMPENIFNSEYEAIFTEGAMSVFSNVRNCIKPIPRVTKPTIAAVDVGRANDATCVCIMQDNAVVHIESWKHDSWTNIVKKLVDRLIQFNVRTVTIEQNGVGSPFITLVENELRTRYSRISVDPWTTTNTSKQNIVEKLIDDFATENIIIPNDEELLLELDNFECEYSPKSHVIKYFGREPIHDDYCMALCLCNFNRPKSNFGHYHFTTV